MLNKRTFSLKNFTNKHASHSPVNFSESINSSRMVKPEAKAVKITNFTLSSITSSQSINLGEEFLVKFQENELTAFKKYSELDKIKPRPAEGGDLFPMLNEKLQLNLAKYSSFKNKKEIDTPPRTLKSILNDLIKSNKDIPLDFILTLEEQYLTIISKINEIKLLEDFKLNPLYYKDKLYLIAVSSIVLHKEFGFYLNATQILSILILTLETFKNGYILQIDDGESKSFINAVVALYFALQKRNIDIILSNTHLVIQEQKKFENFFSLFGISSSHICGTKLISKNYSYRIIYGINSNFEFYFLMDYAKNDPDYMRELMPYFGRSPDIILLNEVDNLFIDKNLYDPFLRLTSENPLISFIHNLINNFKCKENIPELNLLCDFVIQYSAYDKNLMKYANNNIKIYVQGEKKMYLHFQKRKIKNSSSELDDINDEILLREESPNNSNCHPDLYKKYKNILGLTGIIENEIEKNEIIKSYNVGIIEIPTDNKIERIHYPSIFCKNQKEFEDTIKINIAKFLNDNKSILILCETEDKALSVEKFLLKKELVSYNLSTITDLTGKSFSEYLSLSHQVIIATNLYALGADIDIKNDNGLHVILTYFPSSKHIKHQAISLSAKQGKKGSCQFIIPFDNPIFKDHFNLMDPSIQDLFYISKTQDMIFHKNIDKINLDFSKYFFAQMKTLIDFSPKNDESYILKLNNNFRIEWILFFSGLKDILNRIEELYKSSSIENKLLCYEDEVHRFFHEYKDKSNFLFKIHNESCFDNVDLFSIDENGNTPLHKAILLDKKNDIRYLIKIGSQLDIKNKFGETPLYLACERADVITIRTLIFSGASIDDKAYVMARNNCDRSIFKILLRAKTITQKNSISNELITIPVKKIGKDYSSSFGTASLSAVPYTFNTYRSSGKIWAARRRDLDTDSFLNIDS